jgi:hypothetical protein
MVDLEELYGAGHAYYHVSLTPEGKYAHDNPEPKIVFLSHAAADEEIARHLKQVIEASFPQIKVFVSSDPEDLSPGNPWVQTVLANLRSAKLLLILATERGLSRKWVWFETGAGWSSGPLFIPCFVGKIRKGQLPYPFSGYQALNIDEEGDFGVLVDELTRLFGTARKAPESRTAIVQLTRLEIHAGAMEKIQRQAANPPEAQTIPEKSAKEALRDQMLLLVAAHEDTGSATYLSDQAIAGQYRPPGDPKTGSDS